MPPDPFWSNLFRRRDHGGDELYEVMSKVPVFQDLSRREFERVREVLHPRTYAAEEAIVREGDPGVGMYVILSGEVAVLQEEGDGAAVEVATFGEGDFFGDQVLLDESPRNASAVARQPTRVMGFYRAELLQLIQSQPRIGLKVVMQLSRMAAVRLHQTNRLLREARQRVRRLEAEADSGEPADGAGAGEDPSAEG
ncbi:MAG: cyclic nucleotide-binding domain-containing protein [Gemmatimonadaceae bacterium]|nr:cyclic nucleotide-binding domain-containing protein [Gemmatimonadaceae bacterium]